MARAVGTKLKKGTVEVGSLTSIGGIEITAETIDKTTLDSDGGYREFEQGFKDAGEVPIEGYFDPEAEGQIAMQTSLEAGGEEDYTIEFPTTPKAAWNFKGVVTAFKVGDVDLDGMVNFGATIKISGKPNLTIGAQG